MKRVRFSFVRKINETLNMRWSFFCAYVLCIRVVFHIFFACLPTGRPAIMIMDESFTSDDLHQFEQTAQNPNTADITVCSCIGMCLRDNGRNACPCKTIDHYCTSACHPDAEIECMNARKNLESYLIERSWFRWSIIGKFNLIANLLRY